MKRTAILLCLVLFVFGGFFSVSAQKHANEDVVGAMSISMGAYVSAIMMSQMGSPPEGVEFDQETGNVTFTNFDVTEITEEYSELSGDVTVTEENTYEFDFALKGGPISTISYSLTEKEMQEQPEELVVIADGREYVLPYMGPKPAQ
jgi:hypothetical protein